MLQPLQKKASQQHNAGRLLTAKEALDWGLVDEIVPAALLRERVQAYAAKLAVKPAPALAAIRRLVTLGGGASFEEGMSMELETAAEIAETADFQEGVTAFLQKRAPKWDA